MSGDAICRVLHSEGWIAEVVSDFEYEKARHNGVPGPQIVFNGPWKSPAALRRAVAERALVQVDPREEVLELARIAREVGREIPVALRVHLDTGTHAPWSKFGFDADGGGALRMLRWIATHTRLRVRGLHAHIGTFMLDPGAYSIAMQRLVSLALAAEDAGAGPIEYLNAGGGFASHARLHGHFLPPDQATPSFDRYAAEICGTLLRLWPADRRPPRLILETGRALVDEAGFLLTTVVAVKEHRRANGLHRALAAQGKALAASSVADERHAVVVDAGVQLLYTSAWYRHLVSVARPSPGPVRPTTVFGALCMNIDVLREEAPLPEDLCAGDALVLHPVGAYNWTQSMQFTAYRPAVVLIDPDCVVHVIRRREQLEDVTGPEAVPEHLAAERAPVSGEA